LTDAGPKLRYLFAEPPVPAKEEFFPKKGDLPKTIALLKIARFLVEPMANTTEEKAEELIKDLAVKNTVKLGDLMMPLRVAITGARVSPPLFGSLRLLGPEKSLARVDRALASLEA
jgi:glutamyl-tRNA synthetase